MSKALPEPMIVELAARVVAFYGVDAMSAAATSLRAAERAGNEHLSG